MAWKIKLNLRAQEELDSLDRSVHKRIIKFLETRLQTEKEKRE